MKEAKLLAEQEKRRAAFGKLLERFDQLPTDYDEGEEEDPRPYFSGEKLVARFVCVTVNYTSHGEAKFFFLPIFETGYAAEQRAVEFADDDIFEEIPERVVDLDTGIEWRPDWRSLRWRE